MNQTLSFLIALAVAQLEQFGFSFNTIQGYKSYFSFISKRYEAQGEYVYSESIMDEILLEIDSLFNRGDISMHKRTNVRRCIFILDDLYCFRTFDPAREFMDKSIEDHRRRLPEYYTEYIDKFLDSLEVCSRTKSSYLSYLYKFCDFLVEHEISNFELLTQGIIRNYLAYIFPSHSQSIRDVTCYVRTFLRYIQSTGIDIEEKVFLLLCSPKEGKRKVKPIIPQDDIVKIFSIIDRTKSPGKRDYAMILLAANTGLRAIDIANLKRTDIHWSESEIHLVQSKTGRLVSLPIPSEVKDAIADYILNERPESDSENVFLSERNKPFKTSKAVSNRLQAYVNKAGIARRINDGKTFHGLRRTLGTNMVASGVPFTTVSQVLGHSNTEPTWQYISIDEKGLKKCALSKGSLGGGKHE